MSHYIDRLRLLKVWQLKIMIEREKRVIKISQRDIDTMEKVLAEKNSELKIVEG